MSLPMMEALENRLLMSASVDTSFGNGGSVVDTTKWTGSGVAVDAAGKIWVTSSASILQAQAVPLNSNGHSKLLRFDDDGSPDKSFGTDGVEDTISNAEQIIPLSDGRMLVCASDMSVSRYNADGTLDATFGRHGVMKSGLDAWDGRATVLPDGSIVTAAWTLVRSDRGNFVELDLFKFDGEGKHRDLSFGVNGEARNIMPDESAFSSRAHARRWPSFTLSVSHGSLVVTAAGGSYGRSGRCRRMALRDSS